MKRLAWVATILLLGLATPALAQRPAKAPEPRLPAAVSPGEVSLAPGEVTPTPEMWFYQQELRQREDPKNGVHEKAQFRSTQRQSRLASRQWFGLSNSRPVAGSDPIHGDYSPHWTSNNSAFPARWTAVSPTLVVQRPEGRTTY
jgi:hypothetical protein